MMIRQMIAMQPSSISTSSWSRTIEFRDDGGNVVEVKLTADQWEELETAASKQVANAAKRFMEKLDERKEKEEV